jgi:hypothetical protein
VTTSLQPITSFGWIVVRSSSEGRDAEITPRDAEVGPPNAEITPRDAEVGPPNAEITPCDNFRTVAAVRRRA